jgi:hypothetical protein
MRAYVTHKNWRIQFFRRRIQAVAYDNPAVYKLILQPLCRIMADISNSAAEYKLLLIMVTLANTSWYGTRAYVTHKNWRIHVFMHA